MKLIHRARRMAPALLAAALVAAGVAVSPPAAHATPQFTIMKEGPASAFVGDIITYTFTATNTSTADETLVMGTLIDDQLGDVSTPPDCGLFCFPHCFIVSAGGTCSFDVQYEVQPDDVGSLTNTVDVTFSVANVVGTVTGSASHTTEVSFPPVAIEKTGPPSAGVGDPVTYEFTITNHTMAPVTLSDVTDTVLGSLTDAASGGGCGTLGPGASCAFEVTRAVLASDSDPLENTVTATYDTIDGPFSRSDTHSVDITELILEKTGPASARVGETVTYTFSLSSTGPTLTAGVIVPAFFFNDTVLGDLSDQAFVACPTLAAPTPPATTGPPCTFQATHTVGLGDPDPLVNTATATYASPGGFPFPFPHTDSDTHSLDIIPPLAVTKSAPALAQVGDSVPYTFTITNNSFPGGPTLTLDSVLDDVLGDLTAEADAATPSCTTLAPEASCTFTVSRPVLAGDDDPLENEVTARYNAEGFPEDLVATATDTVNLFQPSVEIVKAGPPAARVGDDVTYTFTVTNTSTPDSPPLVLDSITDTLLGPLATPGGCSPLAPGATCMFSATRTVLAGDDDPLSNEVTASYHPEGFTNAVTASDTHTLDIVEVLPEPEGASLTVTVVGGDPSFVLDPPVVAPFTLDPDESVTFDDLPPDDYTLTMTALEPGLVLDAITCGPATTAVDLAARSVIFEIDADPVTCTFTVSEADDGDGDGDGDDPYDGYDDDPGDPDFDFDTPFGDDDADDDEPTTIAEVAGENANNQNPAQQPAAPEVLPETAAPAPDTAPLAFDTLPRTGSGASNMTILAGLFLTVGGLALVAGRRRKTSQA